MNESDNQNFLSGLSTLFSSSGKKEKPPTLPSADVQGVMQAVMSGLTPGTTDFFKALNASAEQNGILPTSSLGPFGGLRDKFSSDAQNLAKKQQNLSAIGTQMQTALADAFAKQTVQQQLAPPLESIQANFPSIRPTASQMQIAEGPRPTGPGMIELPAEGPGLPQQRDLMSTDAFLQTLSPQEQAQGRFQRELDQRGPGTYQEGLRPTTLQPTGADVELYGPGAPIERQIPGVKANLAQNATFNSLLAGHTLDPRSTMVTPALQASRETPITVNPGDIVATKQGQPLFTAPGKPIKDNEELRKFQGVLQAAGIDPASDMGKQLYTEWAKKIANPTPSTQVTTNVNTEKKYGEIFGSKVAENDVSLMDSATRAPALADRANRILSSLSAPGVITGTGAEARLQLGKAFKLAGLTAGEGIEETESMMTDMAANTLDGIKASGLGSGTGFSNADRDFLEKVKGGKITLEPGTIRRITFLNYLDAYNTAKRWNDRVKRIPQSALEGTGLSIEPIVIPPLTISGDAEWAKLPNGVRFIGPDGKVRTK